MRPRCVLLFGLCVQENLLPCFSKPYDEGVWSYVGWGSVEQEYNFTKIFHRGGQNVFAIYPLAEADIWTDLPSFIPETASTLVKSGYWVARDLSESKVALLVSHQAVAVEEWNLIGGKSYRRSKCRTKQKIFLQRACSNILPTAAYLFHKCVIPSESCSLCLQRREIVAAWCLGMSSVMLKWSGRVWFSLGSGIMKLFATLLTHCVLLGNMGQMMKC